MASGDAAPLTGERSVGGVVGCAMGRAGRCVRGRGRCEGSQFGVPVVQTASKQRRGREGGGGGGSGRGEGGGGGEQGRAGQTSQ
jgi:hypothetical protein